MMDRMLMLATAKEVTYATRPVGVREVAALFEVEEKTVSTWRVRYLADHPTPCPLPHWTVSGFDAFDEQEWVAWGETTGRLINGKPHRSAA